MIAESTLSSRVSLISIDPAVASQITRTTTESSRVGSSPAKRSKTSDTEMSSRGHARTASAPSKSGKKQSNSLRLAKNSTEVLRQRSVKSRKRVEQLETIADTRGGRNFTIGNVGTGGVLYLRPSAHRPLNNGAQVYNATPLGTTITVPSVTKGEEKDIGIRNNDYNSQTTVRSASPTRPISKRPMRISERPPMPRHTRSHSFSTVEDHRRSVSASNSKTLRIVINRPDIPAEDHQSILYQDVLPTLEVPIPHYRIGTPRFSTHGTAFLRSSSYTRTSANPSIQSENVEGGHQGPPSSNWKAFARLESSQQKSLDRSRSPVGAMPKSPASNSTTSTSRTDSTIRGPVYPELYDELNELYDDPSVVRYSQNIREVTAATPARIVAQISSESFMDYELVSDFFLTFRCYMSTHTTLDLLLARLRWSIDRQEEDGRIIRVRTFAALRHWILNYFLDDFVNDERLRVRFCDQLNKLYREVKARPNHSFSDLKVLTDLKRCWQGRCSLYWDPEDYAVDGNQDEDLLPGGQSHLLGTQGEDLPVLEPLTLTSNNIKKSASMQSWFDVPPVIARPQHDRQISTDVPESIQSEASLQALSCSIPKKVLRSNGNLGPQFRGPQPVSVQSRRKNAPANLQVSTTQRLSRSPGHKRGASSIDSARESTPRETEFEVGSIIRGMAYAPGAPFVQLIPSQSTVSLPNLSVNNLQTANQRRAGSPSQTPGVKNIFGSLRKALGGKHSNGEVAIVAITTARNQSASSQRPAATLNNSRPRDEIGSKARATAVKAQIRIDLLCAAAVQNHEETFSQSGSKLTPRLIPKEQPESQPRESNHLKVPASTGQGRDRYTSQATAQSGSILIVDDTGFDMPAMSGALGLGTNGSKVWQEDGSEQSAVIEGLADPDLLRTPSIDPPPTQRSSNVFGESMDLMPGPEVPAFDHGQYRENKVSDKHVIDKESVREDQGRATPTLHNRSSSDINVRHPDVVATTLEITDEYSEDEERAEERKPAKTIRRRPAGGNLRRADNVHQLDHSHIHHESIDSLSARSNSATSSLLIMSNRLPQDAAFHGPPEKKVVSMINTHSSQHLRPSFEAAVAGFSAIPDDDDGGFEATLMKLEGRYEKPSPPLEQHPIDKTERRRSMPNLSLHMPLNPSEQHGVREKEETYDRVDHKAHKQVSSAQSSIFGLPTDSGRMSSESFDSLPLLKRGTAEIIEESGSSGSAVVPTPAPLKPKRRVQGVTSPHEIPQRAMDVVKEVQTGFIRRPETANDSTNSFLLDEDENLSDLSSEISVDIINYSDVVDRSFSPMLAAPGTALSGLEIPSHPLTYASVVDLSIPPERLPNPSVKTQKSQLMEDTIHTPTSRDMVNGKTEQLPTRVSGSAAHIPFILAIDSQILAQQLTLVEKSALSEIEWSDLVEMRWDSKPSDILDWVDYLKTDDLRGIDLVITRFNLVVKWALSEIVLTQNIQERAMVITKYIHVAAHARRLHNYATMLQITIALTSADCTRLTQTWELISAPDKSLLKNMEALIQPIRNFHDLRLEMESTDLSDGCIPFVGK